jgi:dihydrofolate synthase / folylpolyglutamate synthase
MQFESMKAAIDYLMHTRRSQKKQRGLDELTRNLSPSRNLLLATGLLKTQREYCVVTGSKGKGSTAALAAKLLESLGHKTGLITSPHMREWNERIRTNGKAIPEADFARILGELVPFIDIEIGKLEGQQYLGPQGLMLLIALRWWDEQGVRAAVLEVGRGGRFDDMSLMPNKVSIMTPIFMEHARYLGDSLARIAWHKSGIIKEGSYVYSVAQDPLVMDILQKEADARDAQFTWLAKGDLGQFVEDIPNGIRFNLGRYGDLDLPFYGHYQIENASLAIQAVGNMHSRLQGIAHNSLEYIEAIKTGLAATHWQGRVQKLQDNPAVYVDGAINVLSATEFLASLRSRITHPLVIIAGVPKDRYVEDVYKIYADAADTLILTESDIHPTMPFPDKEDALEIARCYHGDVHHRKTLPEALDLAYEKAGTDGTILMGVAQSLVGESLIIWDVDMQQT